MFIALPQRKIKNQIDYLNKLFIAKIIEKYEAFINEEEESEDDIYDNRVKTTDFLNRLNEKNKLPFFLEEKQDTVFNEFGAIIHSDVLINKNLVKKHS